MLACFALGWWCMGLVNKKNTASAENSPPVVTQPQLQQAATRPKPASRSSVVTINAPVPPDPDATPEPPVVVDLPLPRSTGQRCPVPQEVMDETPDTTRRARDIYERNAKALLTLSK